MRFASAIFDICRVAQLSPRGEYELAIGSDRSDQQREIAAQSQVGVLDLSRRADIVEVARRLRAVEPKP